MQGRVVRHPAEAGLDEDPAVLVPDGFRGVDDQVHHGLADLGRIRLDGGQPLREAIVEAHFLADGNPQQVGHFPHEGVHVQGLDGEAALPGVGQELAAQLRRPLDGGGNLQQMVLGLRRVAVLEALPRQVRVPHDRDEQVVEVVGDPPGEDSQALQLLCLEEGRLPPLLLRDVGEGPGDSRDPALGSPRPHPEPPRPLLPGPEPHIQGLGPLDARAEPVELPEDLRTVLLDQGMVEGLPEGFLHRETGEFGPGAVEELPSSIRIQLEHDLHQGLEHAPVLGLPGLQVGPRLGPFADQPVHQVQERLGIVGPQLRLAREPGIRRQLLGGAPEPLQHRKVLLEAPVLALVHLPQLLVADDQAAVAQGEVAVELGVAGVHGLQERREPPEERGVPGDGAPLLGVDSQVLPQLDGQEFVHGGWVRDAPSGG